MDAEFRSVADALLQGVAQANPGVPGVVAIVTNREGDVYEGASGVRRLGEPAPMTRDTVFALFSCTKAITATAALQLVEQGRLDLDAPAKNYAPDIAALQVLEGFDAAGGLRLRPPRRAITTRMLLLHTAGFGYDFANATAKRLIDEHGQPSHRGATRRGFMAPLLFEPGERWEYGLGLDWCGMVMESILGERLDAILDERVLAPLGMKDTRHAPTASMIARRASMHQREPSGAATPFDSPLRENPEIVTGGGGMHGTVPDYTRFLRMWLNDGAGETARVLKPETIAMAARDGLGGLKVRPLPSVDPRLSNPVDFFPGQSKSWGVSFMINDEDAPTGRPAGSLAWAGLGNLYYWIDRRNGITGFWATQIFPFMDPTSLNGFSAFETAVYEGHRRALEKQT